MATESGRKARSGSGTKRAKSKGKGELKDLDVSSRSGARSSRGTSGF